MKSEVKNILMIFFDIKVIIHKQFALVGQTINSAAVTFYGNCMKICGDFRTLVTKERAVTS
jgi:hypothetical protein